MSENWKQIPFHTLFRRIPKRTGYGEKELLSVYRDYGVVVKSDRDDNSNKPGESLDDYQLVNIGDLVLNKMKTWQGSLGISNYEGIVSPAYFVFEPRSGFDNRYMHHLLRSQPCIDYYGAHSKGIRVNQWDLQPEYLDKMKVWFPPLETQQHIADYLDRETAEIDAAVADLDRYVELLRKRQLAAEDAIIWGESVEYVRLKFLIDELDERAGQNRVDWPLLSVSIHNGVQERIEDRSKIQAVSDKLDRYKVVQTGDIVLNRMRAFQGALGISSSAGLTSPDYAVLRPHDESSAMWITLVMKTRKFVSQMAMNIRGIGSVDQGNARTPRINVSQLFDFKIPMPDKILRDQIVEMILRDQDELRRIVAESNHLRELLLKRRSVLINDVVTGRKRV
ncbi:type I restriction-modification system specificity subunit [Corynebacterium glutamicum MT]|uniref:Type I restriction endonuclease subunit S n=1 Tax=Corynebacterium glutamicum TaxID=1718 RepID=A0AB36IDD8_CORGT|nr:restriction endonuclease subunit S [Corynebacterium glutamicum]AGN18296.1 type I restriction-modification system specificity subunit [Corynebacterium glutamicum SCgG1]AGN21319.1 type I restriction-modification system specificity subunit [Corynebacterium glutamicum SCgG2]EGV41581.1 type I restriction-modification system specificity subunit [Corynebacterium glutamicum S9114]EOA63586.1 type I restriction-modification system specificity subunit [Corynebacterium glutamicum MT]EPP41707.1 type I r